jgi:ElaB/YqjD/DUF883 family membrane-anchored ribosome-binding protein
MTEENQYSKRILDSKQFDLIERMHERMVTTEVEHLSPQAKENFDRLLKGVVKISNQLKRIDLDLLAPQFLQNVHANLKNINAELTGYFKTPSDAHLTNANQHLDTIAQTYPFLLLSQPLESSEDYKELIQSYSTTADTQIATIKKAKDTLKNDFESLKTNFVAQQKELDQAKEELSKLRSENSSITTQQNEVFISSQQQRDSEFKNIKNDIQENLDAVISTKEEEFEEKLNSFQKSADDKVSEIEAMLEKAKQTFQNLGVVVQTGKYQEFADKEARAAFWLRIGAIVSLAVMFVGTLWVIFKAEQDQLSWNLFLLRFLTVASLSILGYYFARESTRHRKKEHQYRRIQLELTSLTPYLEFFDEAKKKEIKEKLVEKYFGREEVEPVDDKQLLTKKDLMEIIAKIPTS